MIPAAIWLRRGTGRSLLFICLGLILITVFSQPVWQAEADWGLRLVCATVLPVSPLVAAAVAYDVAKHFRPTLLTLANGSSRSSGWSLAVPLAVAAWVSTAYALSWTAVLVRVAISGGVAPTDPWVYGETIAPIVSAAVLGAAVGRFARGFLAAPIAAGAVLTLQGLASPWGSGPFEAATAFGTLAGIERTPSRAIVAVLAALALASMCGVAYMWKRPVRPRHTIVWVACLAIVTVGPAALPWPQDSFRVTREETRCLGTLPEVCGPTSRLKLLAPVQASMSQAYGKLEGTPFVEPRAFTVTRLDHYSDLDGSAPLDFDPANIHDGQYDVRSIAEALMRPHACADLYDPEAALAILDAQDRIRPWLLEAIRGSALARPVPDEVLRSFAQIQNCKVFSGDLH